MSNPSADDAITRQAQALASEITVHVVNANAGDGYVMFDDGQSLVPIIESALRAVQQSEKRLQFRLESAERAYDRLNLCPDHRDKSNGICICCQAEKNVREEQRERIAEVQQQTREACATATAALLDADPLSVLPWSAAELGSAEAWIAGYKAAVENSLAAIRAGGTK